MWVVAVVASSRSLLRGLTVAHGDGRDGKLAPAERLADLLAVIDDLGVVWVMDGNDRFRQG